MDENKMLYISESYLKELCNFFSRKVMGVILKRIDLLDDKVVLKNVVKEQIFEEFRNFRYQIEAYNEGQEITFFEPKRAGK